MYSKWMKGDKSAIHPDLRSAVFAIAIKNGGKEEVNKSPDSNPLPNTYQLSPSLPATNSGQARRGLSPRIWTDFQWEALYKLATDQTVSPDERNTALRNIGRSKDPEFIKRTLNVALNEVKEQDIYLPFQGYSSHLPSALFSVSMHDLFLFEHKLTLVFVLIRRVFEPYGPSRKKTGILSLRNFPPVLPCSARSSNLSQIHSRRKRLSVKLNPFSRIRVQRALIKVLRRVWIMFVPRQVGSRGMRKMSEPGFLSGGFSRGNFDSRPSSERRDEMS